MQVGRRIAFDAGKGRLWIVCRQCERWNLTPLEERWEAVEEAERLFRDTRVRVSTDHVGLARVREGLELVRIGRPLRPEFAAWRYGDQFGRRRRKALLSSTGAIVVVGSAMTAGLVTGVVSAALLGMPGNLHQLWTTHRTRARIRVDNGYVFRLKQKQLRETRIRPDGAGGLLLDLKSAARGSHPRQFSGSEAERIAGLLMPRLNSDGASRTLVQDSVQLLERAGGPDTFVPQLLQRPPLPSWLARKHRPEDGITLGVLPPVHRLALEMTLHEEEERLAMQGELQALELAWRDAEEVAAIADDLLLPEHVRARVSPPSATET
jgi:hypothetical protein